MDRDPYSPARYLGRGRRRIKAAMVAAGMVPRPPRPCRVDFLPGRSITITWLAELESGGATSLGPVVLHACHRPLPGLDRVAEDEWGNPVYLFRASDDPLLPGLARVLDRDRLAELLAEAGVMRRGGNLVSTLTRFEPFRRATLATSAGTVPIRVEVVPPRRVDDLIERHRLISEGVPAPQCLVRTHDGVAVLIGVPGETMDQVLRVGGRLPGLAEVDAVLDQLPAALVHQSGAVGVLEEVEANVELLAAINPDIGFRLRRIATDLAPMASLDPGPLVPHHGDLRPANVVLRSGGVDGLLDVGSVGEGYRIDDLAKLVGHLVVLGAVTGSTHAALAAEGWLQEIDSDGVHAPSAIRARVAAVILESATDCFRYQEADWMRSTRRRIELAEQWSESAWRCPIPRSGLAVAGR